MQLRLLIFSSFCILFMPFLFGQDSTKTLKEIPVFAKRDTVLRIAVIISPVPHFKFNADKIDELGATDVGEALKYVPGIQLRDYGGIGGIKTVSFRSLGAGHTTVELDGNQIPNVQSGIVNLSSFELFGLESVAFSSGQSLDKNATASAFTQANTISLNSVLSKKPKALRIGLYSNSTTINAYEKGGYIQTNIGKKFYVGFQGLTRFGNGVFRFRIPQQAVDSPDLIRENTRLFNYRLRGLVGYQSKQHKVTASLFFNENTQELPGAAVLFNPSNDQQLWNTDWRFNLNHSYTVKKWVLNTNFKYQSTYTRYLDPNFFNLQGFIDSEYDQRNVGGGFFLTRKFRFLTEKVFLGSDLLQNTLVGNDVSANPFRLQSNTVLGGGTWIKKLRIQGNFSTQYVIDEFTQNNTSNQQTFFRFSPFLSFAYLPIKKQNFRIRAFYKNTFRLPTFNDLYYNFIGNSDVKPEDANLFNLGVTYGVKRKKAIFEITVDAYYNEVKNKIVAIPTKDLFNWSIQNIGETEIRGVDIGALLTLSSGKTKFNLTTNQAFNSSIDVTDINGITFGDQIPYTPFYTNTSGISIDRSGYKFSINALYSSGRYSLNENIFANYLPSYTDINIGLAKSVNWQKSKLRIALNANNILDNNYQTIRSFPVPGRHYQLRLKYFFDK